jgi:hypothetical protein
MMRFAITTLATGLGKNKDGRFSGKGDYVYLKCFYGEEHNQDYGEFFLFLDPVLGRGEISLKDTGYADSLIKAFSRAMRSE